MVGAQQQKASLTSGDATFVKNAGEGSKAEVELGQLAQQKASNDQVKQFGQRMVQDHGKAAKELTELAGTKGVSVPNELHGTHQRARDRLARMQGAAFDKEYMKEMVRDHKKDVAEFRKASQSAKDPDLKAWAGKTLPIIEEHLKMAQDLNKQLSASR
jgi:putative membrane protein